MVVVILSLLDRWARSSQQGARRNAMLATTEATRRRVERDEVAAYLQALEAAPAAPEVATLAR
jgi:hypothetical protein